MTKVAQIFEREKQEAVAKVLLEKNKTVTQIKLEAQNRETALKMLLKGDSLINITEKTGFTEQEIQELIK